MYCHEGGALFQGMLIPFRNEHEKEGLICALPVSPCNVAITSELFDGCVLMFVPVSVQIANSALCITTDLETKSQVVVCHVRNLRTGCVLKVSTRQLSPSPLPLMADILTS